MGGELCINATLAYAKSLGLQQGELRLQRDEQIGYANATRTEIEIPLPYRMFNTGYGTQLVLFDGIGYEVGVTVEQAERRKNKLLKYCKEYSLPAFGFVAVTDVKDKIQPLVYVVKINSCVWETACGSGSIAYYLTRYGDRTDLPQIGITQPTGKNIYVRQISEGSREAFAVSAEVEEITLNRGDRI